LKYRLAAIDLDGTLLHSGTHTVSPGNAAAVERALAQGAILVLASGRQHETIAAFAEELRIPAATPIISYNGALTKTLGGETMAHCPLPDEAARTIVRFCAEHGHHLNYYLNDLLYVRDKTHWADVYQERTGSIPRVVHDLTTFDGQRPTKLLLIDTPEITDRLLLHFQAQFGESLYITKTEDEYLEFMDKGVSKGVALAHTADVLDVPREKCVAMGDSYNDIPMLRWAGLGVVMRSGREEAKAVADLLAPPSDEDGVGAMLDQLFS
jgi:Cof subfamily protein (haloacid dehalogenase superfamily)